MKVIVFGATGAVGQLVLRGAIDRGHKVTAFARTPAKLPKDVAERALTAGDVAILQGDVLDADAVAAAVKGQDAVIVCLGSGGIMSRNTTVSDGTANIIAGLAAAGDRVARVVVVSSMGASESAPWIGGFVGWLLKHPLADKCVQEAAVRASPVADRSVIVRPVGFTAGSAVGRSRLAAVVGGPCPKSSVARADVAGFVLEQLESDEFAGKAVGLSNA